MALSQTSLAAMYLIAGSPARRQWLSECHHMSQSVDPLVPWLSWESSALPSLCSTCGHVKTHTLVTWGYQPEGQGLNLLALHLTFGQPRGHFVWVEHRASSQQPWLRTWAGCQQSLHLPHDNLFSQVTHLSWVTKLKRGIVAPACLLARISDLCVVLSAWVPCHGEHRWSTLPICQASLLCYFAGWNGSRWDAHVSLPCSSDRTISDPCPPQADWFSSGNQSLQRWRTDSRIPFWSV